MIFWNGKQLDKVKAKQSKFIPQFGGSIPKNSMYIKTVQTYFICKKKDWVLGSDNCRSFFIFPQQHESPVGYLKVKHRAWGDSSVCRATSGLFPPRTVCIFLLSVCPHFLKPFPYPAGWNVDVMAGAPVTILEQEDEEAHTPQGGGAVRERTHSLRTSEQGCPTSPGLSLPLGFYMSKM